MSDPLPEPLVPPEVDLRDFRFMPLDVQRLRDSRLVAIKSSDEAIAAILLWSASWHQQPASSLPDDDKELSQLAGYGKAVGEYLKLKEGSLYKFIMCRDGRWYHPVVAEKAAEAWNAKLKDAHRRACDRLRKENKERSDRKEDPLPMPPAPAMLEKGEQSAGIPIWRYRSSCGTKPDSDGIPDAGLRNSGLKGQGRDRDRDREGKGSTGSNNPQREQSTSPDGQPPERAPSEPVKKPEEQKATMRGTMAKILREEGVDVTPHHPLLVAWVDAGVTVQLAREAVDVARVNKPAPARIPAKYLDPIIAELRGQNGHAHKSIVKAKPWFIDTWSALETKAAELGVARKDGEHDPHFRARVLKAAGVTHDDIAKAEAEWR